MGPRRKGPLQAGLDADPVNGWVGRELGRPALDTIELVGSEGAHIRLHDGARRHNVCAVAAGKDVNHHSRLLRRISELIERQGDAGSLQRRVPSFLGLEPGMGSAAGEFKGQNGRALPRYLHLVRWHAALEVHGEIAVLGHGADEVAGTERTGLLTGVQKEVDPGIVVEPNGL